MENIHPGLGNALKSPWVWGGGAVIGVILLMKSGPAAAGAPVPAAIAGAANPDTVISAQVAMNSAALGAEVEKAQINAQYGAAIYSYNVTDHANVLATLQNIDNNNTLIANTMTEANAGITNSLIQSGTAIVIDQSNNAERLGEAYQQTAQAQIQANATVDVAQLQLQGQKVAAHASIIGSIAGAIGNIATLGIGAATGIIHAPVIPAPNPGIPMLAL